MGNQYGYTGLTPALALGREAFRKGRRSGMRAKVYDEQSKTKALARFKARYVLVGEVYASEWLYGWHDAAYWRDDLQN